MPLSQEKLAALVRLPGHQICLGSLEREGIRVQDLAGSIIDCQIDLTDFPPELADLVMLPVVQMNLLMAVFERQTAALEQMREGVGLMTEAVQGLREDLQKALLAVPGVPAAVPTAPAVPTAGQPHKPVSGRR